MTAPFAAQLCGYRRDKGTPNVSDASQADSIAWSQALFDELGIPSGQPAIHKIGPALERAVIDDIQPLRPDLVFHNSYAADNFVQYRHLGTFTKFRKEYRGPTGALEQAIATLASLPTDRTLSGVVRQLRKESQRSAADHARATELIANMPEDSLLNLDIAIGDGAEPARLLMGLSAKWSLRTDRAQDCLSQGSKLVTMRRGPMPGYATLTMEPRPTMLKLIAYGSGSVDCVFHIALPELRAAAATIATKKGATARRQRDLLERMIDQRRLLDYADLRSEVLRLR